MQWDNIGRVKGSSSPVSMTQDKEPVAYIAPSSFWQIHWIVAGPGASASFRGGGE